MASRNDVDAGAKRLSKGRKLGARAEQLLAQLRESEQRLDADEVDQERVSLLEAVASLVEAEETASDGLHLLQLWARRLEAVIRRDRASLDMAHIREKLRAHVFSLVGVRLDSDARLTEKDARHALDALLGLCEAIDLTSPSTSARDQRRALPTALLRSSLWSGSLACLDRKSALAVLEAVMERFGVDALLHAVPDLIARLPAGLSRGLSASSRRGRLVLELLEASSPETDGAGLHHLCNLAAALVDGDARSRQQLAHFVLTPLLSKKRRCLFTLSTLLLDRRTRLGSDGAETASARLCALLTLLGAAKGAGLVRIDSDGLAREGEVVLGHVVSPTSPGTPDVLVVPVELLERCCRSSQRDVRALAANVAMDSRQTAAPLSNEELGVLRVFLEHNFSSSAAEARNSNVEMLASLLQRAGACCVAVQALERQRSRGGGHETNFLDDHPLTRAVQRMEAFLHFVHELCLDALHPAAPYRKCVAALSMLDVLLLSNVDPSYDSVGRNRSGRRPVYKALEHGVVPHFSICTPQLTEKLLQLADGTYPELLNLGCSLLAYFPSPLPGLEQPHRARSALLDKARRLQDAGREAESNAAARLLQLYVRVYTRRARVGNPAASHVGSPVVAQLDFVHEELDRLHAQLDFARTTSLVRAARERPLHALLVGLDALLSDVDFGDTSARTILGFTVERVLGVIYGVWEVTRPILSSRAPEGGPHPDLETESTRAMTAVDAGAANSRSRPDLVREGGGALDTFIAEEGDDEDLHDAVEGSRRTDQQGLLSYCWRAMKESSELLGHVVELSLRKGVVVWTPADRMDGVGRRYLEWLLAIRHRGAFSCIYPALASVATCCAAQRQDDISRLPRTWLTSLLDTLRSSSASLMTTRRSAGVGYAVLAVLVGLCKGAGDKQATWETVDALIAASRPAPSESAATENSVARIHSLNVLKILVEDNVVSALLRPRAPQLLMLVVECFSSPVWGVRNSSLMLFSAILQDAFQTHGSARKAAELTSVATAHPELLPFLLERLRSANAADTLAKARKDEGDTSLFAILLLLSRFNTVEQSEAIASPFKAELVRLLASPNWKMREQAAEAYAAFVPPNRSLEEVQHMVDGADPTRQNYAHGRLLCARLLCTTLLEADGQLMKADRQRALHSWTKSAEMWATRNQLPLTTLTFLEVGIALVRALPDKAFEDTLVSFARSVLRRYDAATHAGLPPKPGQEELLSIASAIDDESDVLSSSGQGARVAAAALVSAQCPPLARVAAAAQLLAALDARTDAAAIESVLPTDLLPALLHLAWSTACLELREKLLPLLSRLAVESKATKANDPAVAATIQLILIHGDETSPVSSRRAALAGLARLKDVLFGQDLRTHMLSLLAARSLLVAMLTDDDATVRSKATMLISRALSDQAGDRLAPALRDLLTDALRAGVTEFEALELAWAWMARLHGADGRPERSAWEEQVWRMLFPEDDSQLRDHLDAAYRDKALFASERPNLFCDRHSQLTRAYGYLRRYEVMGRRGADRNLEDLRRVCGQYRVLEERSHNGSHVSDSQELFLLGQRLHMAASLLLSQEAGLADMPEAKETVDEGWRFYGNGTTTLTPARRSSAPGTAVNLDIEGAGVADGGGTCAARQRRHRIAMISDFFAPNVGGVEGHIYMISRHLVERGHKVIVITHAYSPDRTGVRYLSGGLKVYYVPYGVLARQDTLPNFFALFPILRNILVREGIEIVHGHQALSSMAHEGLLHARTMGLRAVFTDHSLFGFSDAASILTNKLLRFALSDVNHVVCVSHTGKENTVLRAHLDPRRVSVIPNAVVASQLRPRREARRNGTDLTIVVLSRLMYRKGIDLLIAAIPRLCARHPDIRFVVGGDGPKRIELEQMREKYLLHERVELVGAIKTGDVEAHLNRGQIFLNTSLTEAFGTSIVEAASAGLFVVSTRVGGIPEVLPPHMLRLAAPDEDDVERVTTEAIAYVRSGAHDAQAQHEAVKGMYSWGGVAARLEAVYDGIAQEPPPDPVERLARFRRGGPIAGLVFCIIVAVDMVFLLLLRHIHPDEAIDVEED